MTFARLLVLFLAFSVACAARAASPSPTPSPAADAVRIGILHSLTGAMAISERSLVDAALLAVEEINSKGGVLGRKLEAFILDGGSESSTFAELAERLIVEDRVVSVFGCWTSSARKAVIPVVEKHKNLLWYPVRYEGREQSRYVIYGGLVPNQQILPALEWIFQRFGKRLFLIGTDDVYAHVVNGVVRHHVETHGGTVIDEVYLRNDDRDLRALAQQIRDNDPDAVFNALRGASNVALFNEMGLAGIGPHQVPVISVSLAEEELTAIEGELAAEHFAAWGYFQSLPSAANQRFVNAFRRRYGLERVTDDPMESMYDLVHLFAAAVTKAQSTDPAAIRTAVLGMEMDAPSGRLKVDPVTQHVWKALHIGQITRTGQFKVLWSSPGPIEPKPFEGIPPEPSPSPGASPSPEGSPSPDPSPSPEASPTPQPSPSPRQ